MEQFQKEKEELDKGCRECKRKLAECQRKLKELEVAEAEGGRAEVARLQAEAQQLRNEERGWESKLEELKKKEKNMPWNVDTLSKDGFSKVGFQVFFWFLGGCFRSVPPPHPGFRGWIRGQATWLGPAERLQRQAGGEGGDGGAEGEEAQKLRGEIREADQTLR